MCVHLPIHFLGSCAGLLVFPISNKEHEKGNEDEGFFRHSFMVSVPFNAGKEQFDIDHSWSETGRK